MKQHKTLETRVPITIRMPSVLAKSIKQYAKAKGISINKAVIQMFEKEVNHDR